MPRYATSSIRHALCATISWLGLFAFIPPLVLGQFRDVTPVPEPSVMPQPSWQESGPLEPTPDANPDAKHPWGETTDATATREPEAAEEEQFTVEQLENMLSDEMHFNEDEDDGDWEDDFSLRSLRFRGITVGQSTLEELLDLWGKPFKLVKSPESRIVKYRPRPFRQVDVTVVEDTVVAILIHLHDFLDPIHCSRQLRLSHLEPVPVPDEYGKILGLAFPERGVLYSFDTRDPETLVAKIQLEPINPEPFLLRAEYDFDRRLDCNLDDVDQALELSPRYARAHWLRADLLARSGRFQDALEAADTAIHYDPTSPRYELTKASIMAQNGNHDAALRDVKRLLDRSSLSQELRATGECLLGNLLAQSSEGRYKEAMEHHLRSIESAAPLANEREFVTRRMAKETLIEAHISVARDISLGEFQSQETTVPKWLGRARALVEEYVERDQGDPAARLNVYRQTLATGADLRSHDDPVDIIDEMSEEGLRQIEGAEDAGSRGRLEWKLGVGLAEAVRLERIRGSQDHALDLADEALALLQKSARLRQSTPEQRYLVGRLYFHVGSLHAVQRENHDEAIAWYRKSEPLLSGEVPPGVLADPGTHGEMFVSMGVSYWETGKHKRAIQLTEQGTDVLQRAVVDGMLKADSLAIPYGNLATMHEKAGNESEAEAFAELAAAIHAETARK